MVTALKIRRVAKGLTQKTLATITGLTQTRISLLENGLAPSDSEALALSVALGKPAEILFSNRSLGGFLRHGPAPDPTPAPSANFEAEQSVLGAILVRPGVFPAVIDRGVKAESFSGRLTAASTGPCWTSTAGRAD